MSATNANLNTEQKGFRYSRAPRFDPVVNGSRKRSFSPDGSREHPIIIDDSIELKTKIKTSPRKRQRTSHQDHLAPARPTFSEFSEIAVVSGAGISVKAGCELIFCIIIHDAEFLKFLPLRICESLNKPFECQLTPFHQIMDNLASENCLLRHITQNIDCLEQKSPDLNTNTLRLHGQIDQMRCEICYKSYLFQPRVFLKFYLTDLPSCQQCVRISQARISNGRRALPIGKLKPDVLLYGKSHPDDNIFDIIDQDLATCSDLVLVVGTKLRVPGAREIATRLCKAARRVGEVAVWIGYDNAPLKSLFDHVIGGDCHERTLSEERKPASHM
ncbi:hypothetical protein BGAL_0204g00120 [Botrytis galanthina]|uniref:Deacetylase sirtuin-type domain-containing protein n=1 Tax=Botrytis galanthina TaxID=278940 RepID=A0A4V4HUG3_9HELO|nr:hypothetical protein BGAL_0204g00120 [Botrytis galanthina]